MRCLLDFTSELDAIGIVPHSPPSEWDWDVSHLYRYTVSPRTAVRFLAQRYRVSRCCLTKLDNI